MSEKLIILSTLVLLPLIPAYLLFKLLPASGEAKGMLGGLEVKFGGAFAGYIALTVFLATFFAHNLNGPAYRVWRINGALQFEPGAAAPDSDDISCQLRAQKLNVDINPGNTFNFVLPMTEDDLPLLVFSANGFEGQTVNTAIEGYGGGIYGLRVDRKTGLVTFEKPILLKKKSTGYQPTVAPIPVTGG
ncbi:MAG TPA: hypothetical protein VMU84_16870 [Thermoanaerobaculia bacterium]|nr:hypothetical protein [Thermoanaerobaculia bacterium]